MITIISLTVTNQQLSRVMGIKELIPEIREVEIIRRTPPPDLSVALQNLDSRDDVDYTESKVLSPAIL